MTDVMAFKKDLTWSGSRSQIFMWSLSQFCAAFVRITCKIQVTMSLKKVHPRQIIFCSEVQLKLLSNYRFCSCNEIVIPTMLTDWNSQNKFKRKLRCKISQIQGATNKRILYIKLKKSLMNNFFYRIEFPCQVYDSNDQHTFHRCCHTMDLFISLYQSDCGT